MCKEIKYACTCGDADYKAAGPLAVVPGGREERTLRNKKGKLRVAFNPSPK